MKIRTVSVRFLLLLATVMSAGGLWLASVNGDAQRAQTPLDIAEISHTSVAGSSVIVVTVANTGQEPVDASGQFTLVDTHGVEIRRIQVSTGEIGGGERSVVSVPLNIALAPGRYTATLSLVGQNPSVRAVSGLREIIVGEVGPEAAPTPFPTSTLPEVEDDSGGAGFPSWLLLLAGLVITAAGIGYMRAANAQGKPAASRPIPEVSMVRKVKVDSLPVKRPATIKPLVPPRRRGD